MKVGLVTFPGSNCDHDVEHLFSSVLKEEVFSIWHKDRDLGGADLIVLPGGFSYGDYLRTGALAKVSPVMEEVLAFAKKGGHVLGICNGFQILCEAHLLPGAMLANSGMKFLSRFVSIKVESSESYLTNSMTKGSMITCPIAHFEGNYFLGAPELEALEGAGQVVFRYCGPNGEVDAGNTEWNPNGSLNAIAGVRNKGGNVVGLMPHPERAVESLVGALGGDSGRALFSSL